MANDAIIRVVLTLLLAALITAQTNGYCNLVWNDEFTGTDLDTTKWNREATCNGGGNGELQCYTQRPQNVFVRNGTLVLKLLAETYTGTQQGCSDSQGCTATKDFTSGRVNSAGKASFLYGRMEMRAKLINGRGLWPALWMLPTDYAYGGWAASGEIDIMEMKGEHPDIVSGTLHHGGAWPNNMWTTTGDRTFPVDLSQDFHTYGVEWNSTNMVWFVDDRVTDNFNLQKSWWSGRGPNPYTQNGQPWDKRFHFVMNLAVGGNFFGSNYRQPTQADFPTWKVTEMQIDHVRVWQKGGDCTKDWFAPVTSAQPTSGATSRPTSTPSSAIVRSSSVLPSSATSSDDTGSENDIQQGTSVTWLHKNAMILFPAIGGTALIIGAAFLAVGLYFRFRNRFDVNTGLQSSSSEPKIVTIFPGSP